MATRDQSVLYALFELPALAGSRLVLVGLANSLDLTDRALIRLQSRVHFKPQLLNFKPYTKQQIAQVCPVLGSHSTLELESLAFLAS